jgi:Sigma-70 region 2
LKFWKRKQPPFQITTVSFTDTDLIARVLLHEDHHAFGELVRRHQSPVRAFLTRMTRGDSHLADDLSQETFLKAWQKLYTFRGDAKFPLGCSASPSTSFVARRVSEKNYPWKKLRNRRRNWK